MRFHILARHLGCVFFTLLLQTVPLSFSVAQDSYTAKLIEGAKKEGSVMWYPSITLDDAKRIMDLFSKTYPFLKAEFFQASSTKLLNRTVTETKLGRYLFDVVAQSGFETHQMFRSGILQPYFSPERSTYPEMLKDPKGYWTDYFDSYAIIAYNTKLIPPGQNP
jgi:iron(III) transport system substrate-binding protein